MKTPTTKTLIITGAIVGAVYVLLSLLLSFTPPIVNRPGVSYILTTLFDIVLLVAAGFSGGKLLKGKVPNPYVVALFAMAFMYATVRLIAFTAFLNVFVVPLLLVLLIIVGFLLSNYWFNSPKIRFKHKLSLAIGGLVIWFFVCSVLGSSLTRMILSNIMT